MQRRGVGRASSCVELLLVRRVAGAVSPSTTTCTCHGCQQGRACVHGERQEEESVDKACQWYVIEALENAGKNSGDQ